jgi:ABC-type sugar transport system ATPase subunit
VTVLRDGRHVATADRAEVRPEPLIRWMVGHAPAAPRAGAREHAHAPAASPGPPLLEVAGLSCPAPAGSVGRPSLRDIAFTLHRGEVLGVAGLLGAGRTELLEALFGAATGLVSGTIRLDGRPVRFRHPAQAAAAGVALVAEDRKRLGLFEAMSVGQNISIARLASLARFGLVDRRAEHQAVRHAIERHHIRADGPDQPITRLSGGNQQKGLIARWLLAPPRVLLLDEPTRGIDVAAKGEIHALVRDLARHDGLGILLASSELPELLAVADRILVLCDGRLTACLARSEATEERILEAATRFPDRLTRAS